MFFSTSSPVSYTHLDVYKRQVLSDQEALDVAAYMNSQLRPPDPRQGLLSIFR